MTTSFRTAQVQVLRAARKVRIVLFDSDGVLTDGGVYMDQAGGQIRRFDIKDGAGIAGLSAGDWIVGVISASPVDIVEKRMAALGARELHVGVADKVATVKGILQRHRLTWEQLAYMGDDRADLGVLKRAGLAAAPADAIPEVLAMVGWTSQQPGGRGAVRELCDLLQSVKENPVE